MSKKRGCGGVTPNARQVASQPTTRTKASRIIARPLRPSATTTPEPKFLRIAEVPQQSLLRCRKVIEVTKWYMREVECAIAHVPAAGAHASRYGLRSTTNTPLWFGALTARSCPSDRGLVVNLLYGCKSSAGRGNRKCQKKNREDGPWAHV